jgi:hypothetical protein
MEAHLLNRIGNVWPSEGEILKGTCEAAEVSGIRRLERFAGVS